MVRSGSGWSGTQLEARSAIFSHVYLPSDFQNGRIVERRGVDQVIGAIVDGCVATSGAPPTGAIIAANTGAFWHATAGIPVLGADALERLLALART